MSQVISDYHLKRNTKLRHLCLPIFPLSFSTVQGPLPREPSPALITWKYVNTNVHWSLIFLLGGGFALAEAGQATGMSALLGASLSGLDSLPPLATLFVVCLVTSAITEFTSNVAISNIILPVLAEMVGFIVTFLPLTFIKFLPLTGRCHQDSPAVPDASGDDVLQLCLPYASGNTWQCNRGRCWAHLYQGYDTGRSRTDSYYPSRNVDWPSDLGCRDISGDHNIPGLGPAESNQCFVILRYYE